MLKPIRNKRSDFFGQPLLQSSVLSLALIFAAQMAFSNGPALAQSVPFPAMHLSVEEPPPSIDTYADADQFFTYYYKKPKPDLLVPAIKAFESNGDFRNYGALPPFCAFVSRVFAAHPERIAGWVKEMGGLSASSKSNMLLVALEWTDNKEAKDAAGILERDGAILPDGLPSVSLDASKLDSDFQITAASHLDMLWGAFFATGDKRYLHKLISVTPWSRAQDSANVLASKSLIDKSLGGKPNFMDELEKDVMKMAGETEEENYETRAAREVAQARERETKQANIKRVIGEAAVWSIGSNAKRHKVVLDVCREDMNSRPDIAKALGGVIHMGNTNTDTNFGAPVAVPDLSPVKMVPTKAQ